MYRVDDPGAAWRLVLPGVHPQRSCRTAGCIFCCLVCRESGCLPWRHPFLGSNGKVEVHGKPASAGATLPTCQRPEVDGSCSAWLALSWLTLRSMCQSPQRRNRLEPRYLASLEAFGSWAQVQILKSLAPKYEQHHQLRYTTEVLPLGGCISM